MFAITPLQITHTYRNANSFVVPIPNSPKKILVDAGGPDLELYKEIIKKSELAAIFLTHEHADHCLCVDDLKAYYDCQIYASKQAAENVKDPKHNFSQYIDEIPAFSVQSKISALDNRQSITIGGVTIVAFETPGHSPGSMCYNIDGLWFTGDTILNKTKTPLSFPHSSRKAYQASLLSLLPQMKKGQVIYPGHNLPFELTDLHLLLTSIHQSKLISNLPGID